MKASQLWSLYYFATFELLVATDGIPFTTDGTLSTLP